MPLNELLPKAVRLYPQKEAVVCGDLRLNYEQFAQRVWRLANGLLALGMKRKDRVAVLHENTHEYLEIYFAAAHLGIIVVSLNHRLAAKELAGILNDSESRLLIAENVFSEKTEGLFDRAPSLEKMIQTRSASPSSDDRNIDYEDLLKTHSREMPSSPPISDDDVAHLYYTSGTTGRPKGVMLTHKNVKSHALGTIAELRLTDCDRWFHVAPLFHLADAWATFAITWAGGKHVLVPSFDAGTVCRMIQEEHITLSNLIPTMLNMMVNHSDVGKYDYSSLRVILSGGASIAPETVRRIVDSFECDYIQTYGMTETSPYLTLSLLKEHLKTLSPDEQLNYKAKTGREFIGVSLRVVDDAGRDVAMDESQVGEIIVKGDTVTPGYWRMPDETARAIRDGWLYTGDLAVMDSERYVNIVDRKKDMIITGGENVYSSEVENVLYTHAAVLEAAVIGVPDEHWGEAVKACVVLKEDCVSSADEIIGHCRKELAGYKTPKGVDFLEALPRTGSGKIFKKGLREPYLK